jgi:ribosomal protein L7/L12
MTETSREDAGLSSAAMAALRQGNKIEAIKIVRVERNLGLKEAKDCVEDYVRRDPSLKRKMEEVQAEAKKGLTFWLVVLLALGAAAYYLLAGK